MHPCSRASLPALLLAASLAGHAHAGVPSAYNSTLPTCFAPCPMGDEHIEVIVRDLANNPVIGSTVVLDFSNCAGAYVCTEPQNDPYIYDPVLRTIRMVADANGRVDFPLRVGGVCGAGGVRIFADGVLMNFYALASPDQDGDGQVVLFIWNDWPYFQAKKGGNDPTGDFDCDGDVDDDDEFILAQHGSHACLGYVDSARRSSWGRLKSIYR